MKKYKYIICLIIISMFTIDIYSQQKNQLNQADLLSELDNKEHATYGDALELFKLQTDSAIGSREKDDSKSFILNGYEENSILTMGMASLMTARYLNLGGSFLYLIFGTERYAFKACVANNLLNANGSENEKMSGSELIELFSRISSIREDK